MAKTQLREPNTTKCIFASQCVQEPDLDGDGPFDSACKDPEAQLQAILEGGGGIGTGGGDGGAGGDAGTGGRVHLPSSESKEQPYDAQSDEDEPGRLSHEWQYPFGYAAPLKPQPRVWHSCMLPLETASHRLHEADRWLYPQPADMHSDALEPDTLPH